MQYTGGMVVSLRPKLDRRRVTRDPHFRMQPIASSRGERFIILVEGTGRYAESSKPLTESDSRKVLHKLGHPGAVIESMVGRAKTAHTK